VGDAHPVKVLVGYYRLNYKETEILAGFPDLTAAQLYDALSYYDHQAEIDADIEAELSEVLNKFNLEINADGVLFQKLAPICPRKILY